MKFSSKRSLFTITAVCLTTIGLAISWPDVPRHSSIAPIGNVAFAQSAAQTTAKPQMSEVAFKNIQVLKGITVDEFMGTMGLFSAAVVMSLLVVRRRSVANDDHSQLDSDSYSEPLPLIPFPAKVKLS